MDPRWEGDLRGHGIADGGRLSGEVEQFRLTISSPDWIAEQPEAHLLPHIHNDCSRPDADFALESHEVESDGTFVVTLRLRKALGIGQIRAAVFTLLGQIAETATYVRQQPARASSTSPTRELLFEVATGTPPGDGPFATHGHLVRFRVQPATE